MRARDFVVVRLIALNDSPGKLTLGTLWQPRDFASRRQRAGLIEAVCDAQAALGASVLIAPYVLVTDIEHPWLPIAVDLVGEALTGTRRQPMAAAVCVEIDAVLTAERRATLCDAFGQLGPELFLLTVVNFDEIEASSEEVRAVIDLITRLGSDGTPVVLMYAGPRRSVGNRGRRGRICGRRIGA